MDRTAQDNPLVMATPEAMEKGVRSSIALSDIRNPIVALALETWEQIRGEHAMPSRAQMTPRAMLRFLKNTALVEVLDDGRDFRFRVIGDAVNIQQGVSLQGMTTRDLDERMPGYGTWLARAYKRVFEQRTPLAYRGLYVRPADKHIFSHEAVMLPLGDDAAVNHLLVVAA